jgi:hypothetical protein
VYAGVINVEGCRYNVTRISRRRPAICTRRSLIAELGMSFWLSSRGRAY